jgi:anaerobic ribonucleoside-triphosphate reductase
MKKRQKCEVYSRVVGYLSPVSDWNKGKKEEFKDRQTFALNSENSESNIS